ncbi:MAG: glycerol-3-phosphate acyltransferase PlsY, partial [Myxococcota bacterium]
MSLAYLLLVYLIAAIPFGLILTTVWGNGVDLRMAGSGNIGATNVARVFGWRIAAATLLLDLSKGLLPVLLAPFFGLDGMVWATVIAMVAFLGHCYPVYLEFRGGKGVATGAGGMLGIAPIPTAIAVGIWALLLAISGKSSVASLCATIGLVVACVVLNRPALTATLFLAVGITLTHTPNIRRLVRGEESEVVRPVRLGNRGTTELTAEEALSQGPGGGA